MPGSGLYIVGEDKGEAVARRPQADDIERTLPQLVQYVADQRQLEAHIAIFNRPIQQ